MRTDTPIAEASSETPPPSNSVTPSPPSSTPLAVNQRLIVRRLGIQDYLPIWQAMQRFTDNRDNDSVDELWLVQHPPVFTQGQAGKAEHLLNTGDIPVIPVDRGGQVTYHGPGQLVAYPLLDIARRKLGVRQLVTDIEQTIVTLLSQHGIDSAPRCDAPGVYVDDAKICSLGLRIRKGRSFHGLALNVDMDMQPFLRINPCGYAGMAMTQLQQLGGPTDIELLGQQLMDIFVERLGYQQVQVVEGLADV